jgi:1-deoxy-D-xylulose-5-phosphate synthase
MLSGKFGVHLAHKVEESVKHLVLPSVVFEDLGLRYYGPIDGHDIPLLIQTFEFLKRQNEPVLLHIVTQKGKGYAPALDKPDKFHGLSKFKLETGETASAPTPTYSARAFSILQANIPINTLMSALPKSMRHFSRAVLQPRVSSRSWRSIRRLCNAHTT